MKFNKIIIRNFRSYYGENKFEFSVDPKNPVTMIVGDNEGGKSSLMRAIQWCLYGQELKKIRHNESPNDSECSVALNFTDKGQEYRLHRRVASDGKGSHPRLLKILEGREGPVLSEPDLIINGFLPKDLKNWFFYDAEGTVDGDSMGTLDLNGSQRTKEALRKIQGFSQVDQLIKDLEKIYKDKDRERIRLGKNQEEKDIQNKIDDLEEKLRPLLNKKISAEEEEERLTKRQKELTQELIDTPKTKPLQDEKDRTKPRLKKRREELDKLQREMKSFEAHQLPVVLLKQLLVANEVPEQHPGAQSIVPFPDNNKLWKKICAEEECICDREVKKGSDEEKAIRKALIEEAVDPSITKFNNRVAGVTNVMTTIDHQVDSFLSARAKKRTGINEVEAAIQVDEIRLDEIDKGIEKIGDTDETIARIQKELAELEAPLRAASNTAFSTHKEMSEIQAQITQLRVELESAAGNQIINNAVTELLRRTKVIQEYAVKKQQQDEEITLRALDNDLNEAISRTAFGNIRCVIDHDSYAVDVQRTNTGLRQPEQNAGNIELVKTCLIGTVIGQSTHRNQDFIGNATSAPLIIDAPFTKMGTNYIKGCLDVLLKNTEQLILFSLPDDYKKYEEEVISKIGKKYALVKADKDAQGEKAISEHTVFGKIIIFNTYDNEDDNDAESVTQTKIMEIK